MKVITFDLSTGDEIECELVGVSEWTCLMTLLTPEGKKIVRHMDRCEFDSAELQKWYCKDWSEEDKRKFEEKYGRKLP